MNKVSYDKQDLVFSPPLYKQRYLKVLDILSASQPKKVVEFGCAECKFLHLACQEPYIKELVAVDIDLVVLNNSKASLEPLITDHIRPRNHKLTLHLYQGSVYETDSRLLGVDSVVCIELIEHLKPSKLKLFSSNVFGFLQTKTVIITTPNADFNILFNLNGKLRHWDHKFEWTRSSFKKWCYIICEKYGYTVQFDGVGEAPAGCECLGKCSQVAVFQKSKFGGSMKRMDLLPMSYNHVSKITYPWGSLLLQHIDRLQAQITKLAEDLVCICTKQTAVPTSSIDLLYSNLCLSIFCKSGTMNHVQTINNFVEDRSKECSSMQMLASGIVNEIKDMKQNYFSVMLRDLAIAIKQKQPWAKKALQLHKKCSMMICFCHSKTSIPIVLFQKIFQFNCGVEDLLLILNNEMLHGVTVSNDGQIVIVENSMFCEDLNDFWPFERISDEPVPNLTWSEVNAEVWD